MKIAHVIPALTKGGAERVVVDLANAAVDDGHDVSIVAAVPAPPELIARGLRPEVNVMHIGTGSIRAAYLGLVPWLIRNRKWLFGQDVLHCHLTFGSVFASAAQRLRSLLRHDRPVVVETYHAVGMAIPNGERARHAMLLSGRDAVAFMADDPFWRGYAERNQDTIFQTIPNGIAGLSRAPRQRSERYRKEQTSIPDKKRAVVGTVGRLVPARRPDLLIDAFETVTKTFGRDVHFLMGGEGPERGALERAARRKGIAGQVHLPGLVVDPAEPIGLIDLYLTVNVGATTGIAALEAAFLGVPIIALQLQDGYSRGAGDWMWSSPDPSELGAKAVELLEDPRALAELGARQQAFARTRFSVAAMAQAYSALYQAAFERARSVRGGEEDADQRR